MPWLAIDKNGLELIFPRKPEILVHNGERLINEHDINDAYVLPEGTIEHLITRKMTWKEDPMEIH